MSSFALEPTPKTPKLSFDNSTGIFEMSGRSIPENSIDFYAPLMEWLNEYIGMPQSETRLIIKLEYFNTSSSKCLADIFMKLEELHDAGHKVIAEWHYEEDDEDMEETGEDFKKIMKFDFELLPFEED